MSNKLDCVSNDDTLLSIHRYILQEGKSAGVQMIRVSNAVGLELHLAADRALDMAELRYKGMPIGYMSATGITHSAYYEANDYGWLRSFFGGFLTTCGLDQTGEPCCWKGKRYGLHGRIGNTPAQQICTEVIRNDEQLAGVVKGTLRQACQQGEAYQLRRSYYFTDDSASFRFIDEIQNQSGKDLPLQLLYHFNVGYPFLGPDMIMMLPSCVTSGWDEQSQKILHKYNDFEDSVELTLLHSLKEPAKETRVLLKNKGIHLEIVFDGIQLPVLGQWKYLQPREYVMALEPTNGHLNGLQWEAENNYIDYLKPGETRVFQFEIILKDDIQV